MDLASQFTSRIDLLEGTYQSFIEITCSLVVVSMFVVVDDDVVIAAVTGCFFVCCCYCRGRLSLLSVSNKKLATLLRECVIIDNCLMGYHRQ